MKQASYLVDGNLVTDSPFTLDSSTLGALEQGLILAQKSLQTFASKNDFSQKMVGAFGDKAEVGTLKTTWATGDFSTFPVIEIVQSTAIKGLSGAFASATNKIYLSQEFLTSNQGDLGAISQVLLEEYGHYLGLAE